MTDPVETTGSVDLPGDASPASVPSGAPSGAASASVSGALPPEAPSAPRSRVRRARRRGRALVLSALAVVAVAAIVVGAVLGFGALGRSRAAQADFDAAVELMDGAEEDLVVVDETVQAEITSELATRAAEAILTAEQVRGDAVAAIALINKALANLPAGSVSLAEALKESAQARSDMMAEAPTILEAGQKAARALAPADAAVEEIKAAEDLMGRGVAEFNKHTKAGVQQSTSYATQAEARLGSARSLLTSATAAFPEADFSAFVAYIDAKVALITESKSIDSLWLAGKIEESNKKLDAYNRKDAEAVAMARALPDSVRDPIVTAYDALTAEATTAYFAARERARSADERFKQLRESAAADDR